MYLMLQFPFFFFFIKQNSHLTEPKIHNPEMHYGLFS